VCGRSSPPCWTAATSIRLLCDRLDPFDSLLRDLLYPDTIVPGTTALCELGSTGPCRYSRCRSKWTCGDPDAASTGDVAIVSGWYRQSFFEKSRFSDRPILGVGLQRRQKRPMAGIVPGDTVLRIDWRIAQVTENIMIPWL
jgi:hypothetical protein